MAPLASKQYASVIKRITLTANDRQLMTFISTFMLISHGFRNVDECYNLYISFLTTRVLWSFLAAMLTDQFDFMQHA